MVASNLQLRVDRFSDRKAGHPNLPSTQTNLGTIIGDSKMKTCTKCHQEKELAEFYPDHGAHGSQCGYRPDCKACRIKQHKAYCQTDNGKIVNNHYSKSVKGKERVTRYRLRHPERRRAMDAVYQAICKGVIPHPKTLRCNYGNHQAEQYHHWSYLPEHWLDVVPVCRKYHTKIHTRKEIA